MKSKVSRIGLIILAMLMAFPALTACGESEKETSAGAVQNMAQAEQTETEETDDGLVHDNLPELNFDGAVYSISVANMYDWDHTYHVMEELNGEGLNDARFNNILAVEERLNVDITEHDCRDVWAGKAYTNSIVSGDNMYQVGYYMDHVNLSFLSSGYVHELKSIPHIDLTREYWNPRYQEVARIYDKIFFATGPFDLSYIERAHIMMFNKDVAKMYQIENLYDHVKEGTWTIDKMDEVMDGITTDLNGDGVLDKNDRWGYLSVGKQVLRNFWVGADEHIIMKDDEKGLYCASNEGFIDILDRTYRMMYDDQHWCFIRTDSDLSQECMDMFAANQGLFLDMNLYNVKNMRDCPADFGILPYPKGDEMQEEYFSRIESCKGVTVSISNVGDTLDMTGAVMEALYCDALNRIMPQFVEVVLKRRDARDEETGEIIDIILDSTYFDYGDTWWCGIVCGTTDYMFYNNRRDYASNLAKIEKKVNTAIEELLPHFRD